MRLRGSKIDHGPAWSAIGRDPILQLSLRISVLMFVIFAQTGCSLIGGIFKKKSDGQSSVDAKNSSIEVLSQSPKGNGDPRVDVELKVNLLSSTSKPLVGVLPGLSVQAQSGDGSASQKAIRESAWSEMQSKISHTVDKVIYGKEVVSANGDLSCSKTDSSGSADCSATVSGSGDVIFILNNLPAFGARPIRVYSTTSSAFVTADNKQANGQDSAEVLVRYLDDLGAVKVGVTPVMDITGAGSNSFACSPSNENGVSTCQIQSTVVGVKVVNFASPALGPINVTFRSPSIQPLAGTAPRASANGTTAIPFVVAVKDPSGQPLIGAVPSLSVVGDGNNPVSCGPSDAFGNASCTIRSDTPGDKIISVTGRGETLTATFGNANSTATASASVAKSNGQDTKSVTVSLRDSSNQPIVGVVPVASVIGTGTNVVTCSASDSSGNAICQVSSNSPGDKQVVINEPPVVTVPTVTFQPAEIMATNTTTRAPADGSSPVALTMNVRSSAGIPIPGKIPKLALSNGGTAVCGPADALGNAQCFVTSTSAGTTTVSMTDPATSDSLSLTFTDSKSVASVVTSSAIADGSSAAVVQISVLDSSGNPRVGFTPTATSSGGATVTCGASNAQGLASCSVTGTAAGTKSISFTNPPLAAPVAVTLGSPGVTASVLTSNVVADSTTPATVQVRLLDANNNPQVGIVPQVQVAGAGQNIAACSATDSFGYSRCFVTSDQGGIKNLQVTKPPMAGNVPLMFQNASSSSSPTSLSVSSGGAANVAAPNQPIDLSWSASTATTSPYVSVLRSVDGGSTWAPVALNVANTGTFSWTPPAQSSGSVQFSVVNASTGSVITQSAAPVVLDTSTPTVKLISSAPSQTNSPFPMAAVFSEPVTGFTASDLIVTNGTVTGFTGSGGTYNFVVTPSGTGPVSVSVAAGTATDLVGNPTLAATPVTRVYDSNLPTVTTASAPADGTSAAVMQVAVKDGSGNPLVGVTPVGSSTGSATVTCGASNAQGIASCSVTGTVAGTKSVTFTTPSITTPVTVSLGDPGVTATVTTGNVVANGTTPATVQVRLLDSSSNPRVGITPTVQVDGTGLNTVSCGPSNSSGYSTCTITSDQSGIKSLHVTNPLMAGSVSVAFQPTSSSSAPPALAISSGGVTNLATPGSPVPLTWTASSATAPTVSVLLSDDGGKTWSSVVSNITNSGSYSWTPPAVDGKNYVVSVVNATTGSVLAQTAAPVVIDTTTPSVTLLTSAPAQVNGPIPMAAVFSESVSGFTASDLVVTNGTISGFTGSGGVYNFVVIPSGTGPVSVSISSAAATDTAGNPATAAATVTRTFDANVPTVMIPSAPADGTSAATMQVAVKDGSGNPLVGVTPVASATGGAVVTCGSSNAQGLASCSISGTVAGTKSVSFTTPSIATPVTVTLGDPGITASVTTGNVVANGTTPATVQVRLLDSSSNPQVGVTPTAEVSGTGVNTISCGASNAQGYATCTITSDQGGLKSVSVTNPVMANPIEIMFQPSTPPQSLVVASNGFNNVATPSTPVNLTWSATAAQAPAVDVMLSADGGKSWTPVASNLTNTGSYTWTPPAVNGNQYIVSVTNAVTGAVLAQTNSPVTIDNSAPTVQLISSAPAQTNGPIPMAAVFNKNVNGFTAADLVVTNGTVTGFTGSGGTYNFTIIPTGVGPVSVSVAANAATDIAGNASGAATAISRVFDPALPTVIAPSAPADGTSAATMQIVMKDSSGNLQVGVTPSASVNGGASVTCGASNAQGIATCSVTGTTAGTKTVTFTNPALANSVTVDLGDPGVTATVTAANVVADGLTPATVQIQLLDSSSNPRVGVTPTVQVSGTGTNQVTCGASNGSGIAICQVVSDQGGIKNLQVTNPAMAGVVAVAFAPTATQGTPPVLPVATNGLSNIAGPMTPVYIGWNTTSAAAPAVTVLQSADNGVTWTPLATNIPNAGSYSWTPPANNGGLYSLSVINATTGAVLTQTATPVVIDSTAPTVNLITSAPAETNGPIAMAAVFNEQVTGFTAGDLLVTNGTISGFTGSGGTYNFVVTPSGTGPVIVSVAANSATDLLGNQATAASPVSRVFDANVPTIVTASAPADGTSAATMQVTMKDGMGNILVGATPVATASGGATVTCGASNAQGVAICSITGTVAGTKSVTFTNPSLSTPVSVVLGDPGVTASVTAGNIVANGTTPATIQVRLLDSSSNPRVGITPTVTVEGAGVNQITCGASNASGYATCQITSDQGGIKNVSVTNPVMAGTVSVMFQPSTVPPSLAITSNGNINVATPAAPVNLSWTAPASQAPLVDVMVSSDGGVTWTTVANDISNSGSYAWTPPAIDGTQYVVSVVNATTGAVLTQTAAPITVDSTAPTATLASSASSMTNSNIPFSISFSEGIGGFTQSSLVVGNGTISSFSGSGASFTGVISPSAAGPVTLDLSSTGIKDLAGNSLAAVTQLSRTYDNSIPTAVISAYTPSTNPSNSTTSRTVTISGTNVDAYKAVIIRTGSCGAADFSAAVQTVVATPVTIPITTDGNYTVCAIAKNIAGNWQLTATSTSSTSLVIDTTPPTANITSTASSATNSSPIPVTVTFNEAVTGFTSTSPTVGNGTISGFSGSGTTYTFNVAPSGQGAVTIDVAANRAQDAAGNNNSAATQLSRTYDTVAPTVTITSTATSSTNTSPIPITVTFNKAVTGFTSTSPIVGNGTISGFSGSGTTYTFNVTPGGQGAVTVDVAANSAQDAAGNNNSAAAQLSRTYDTVVPTVTITSTAPSITNTSPIPVTVTFSKSVTGFTSASPTINNGTVSGFAGSGTTYTFDVTPSGQGAVTIDVAANSAQDSAGNNNSAATQISRTYDTVVPTVTITSAATSSTNTSPIPFTVTFSKSVTGFTSTSPTVGGGTLSGFSGSGTTYTFNVTPSGVGTVTVDVAANTAQDTAGNNNSAATQLSRAYDNTQPSVSITSTAAATTSVTPIPITVTFSRAVTGFTSTSPTVSNGTLGNFAGSGTTYTFDVTPTTDGAVTVNLAALSATDAFGNGNTVATQLSRTYVDATPPSVVITSSASSPTSTSPIPITVTFSKQVTPFYYWNMTVTNGTMNSFTGNVSTYTGTTFTGSITPTGGGPVTLRVPANTVQSAAAVNNTISNLFSINFSEPNPVPVVSYSGSNPITTTQAIAFTVTYSYPVSLLSKGALNVTNGTVNGVSGSGKNWTVYVFPNSTGTVSLQVAAGASRSSGTGKLNSASNTVSVTYSAGLIGYVGGTDSKSGQIIRASIDPNNPTHIYTFSTDRYVRKSTDSGATFSIMCRASFAESQSIGYPYSVDGTFYFSTATDRTIYVTARGGADLEKVINNPGGSCTLIDNVASSGGLNGYTATQFGVDSAGTLFASSPGGISKSTDQGTTWTQVSTPNYPSTGTLIMVNPYTTNKIIWDMSNPSASNNYQPVVSNDGGATSAFSTSTPTNQAYSPYSFWLWDPSNVNRIYSTMNGTSKTSADGGATWTTISDDGFIAVDGAGNGFKSQALSLTSIKIRKSASLTSPSFSDLYTFTGLPAGVYQAFMEVVGTNYMIVSMPVYGGTTYAPSANIFYSADGGTTFTAVTHTVDATTSPSKYWSVVGEGNTLYAATRGSAKVIGSTDGGATWTDKLASYPGTISNDQLRLELNAMNTSRLVLRSDSPAGGVPTGGIITSDGFATYSTATFPNSYQTIVAQSYTDLTRLFMFGAIPKISTDSGATFTTISSPPTEIAAQYSNLHPHTFISSTNSDIVYFGADSYYLYKYNYSSNTVTNITANMMPTTNRPCAMDLFQVSGTDHLRIADCSGRIMESSDDGATFSVIANNPALSYYGARAMLKSYSGNRNTIAFGKYQGGTSDGTLNVSTDAGVTWRTFTLKSCGLRDFAITGTDIYVACENDGAIKITY